MRGWPAIYYCSFRADSANDARNVETGTATLIQMVVLGLCYVPMVFAVPPSSAWTTSVVFIVKKPLWFTALGTGCVHPSCSAWSTQPSTLSGTVNEYRLFGLSNNNKWRWWLKTIAAYRRTQSPSHSGGLVWGSTAACALFCIHQMNRVNSHNGLWSWW